MYLKDNVDVIIDYLTDSRFNQAVLINGAWGTGKTFFVNEILSKKFEEMEYAIIHYSLYGVNSCEQIRKEIEYKILTKICERKYKIPSKLLEYIPVGADIVTKIASEIITKKTGINILSPIKNAKNILGKIEFDTSKIIIIFDDLERTSVEINNVLGLINSFVENKKMKVIIVANEDEIGSSRISSNLPEKFLIASNKKILISTEDQDNNNTEQGNNNGEKIDYEELIDRTKILFSNDIIYNAIKEKLVGLTITLNANIEELYEEIVLNYTKSKCSKEFLLTNKDIVIETFQNQECQNLRTLIFSIIIFEKIYLELKKLKSDDQKYNQELDYELVNILKSVSYESIRYRMGDVMHEIDTQKSSLSYFMEHVKEYKFVIEFVRYHEFNGKEARKIVDNFINDNLSEKNNDDERKKLSYYKLGSWEWLYLKDVEVVQYLNELYNELELEKYETRDFKGIIILLICIEDNFINKYFGNVEINHYTSEYVQLMKKYMNSHKLNSNIMDQLSIPPDSDELYKKYSEYVKELIDICKNKDKNSKDKDIKKIFMMSDWDDEFYQYCKKNRDLFLQSHSFLSSFNIQCLISKLKEANNKQIDTISKAICTVYHFGNLRDFYQNDISELEKIIKLFGDLSSSSNCDCTKKIILETNKEKLEKKLAALK